MYWKDIGIFAILIASGALYLRHGNELINEHQQFAKNAMRATGTIQDPDKNDEKIIDTGSRQLTVSYTTESGAELAQVYKVSGDYYKKHIEYSFIRNPRVTVVYNPINPVDSFLEGSERRTATHIGWILSSVGSLGLCIAMFKAKKKT
jgi:hypothetical protein